MQEDFKKIAKERRIAEKKIERKETKKKVWHEKFSKEKYPVGSRLFKGTTSLSPDVGGDGAT